MSDLSKLYRRWRWYTWVAAPSVVLLLGFAVAMRNWLIGAAAIPLLLLPLLAALLLELLPMPSAKRARAWIEVHHGPLEYGPLLLRTLAEAGVPARMDEPGGSAYGGGGRMRVSIRVPPRAEKAARRCLLDARSRHPEIFREPGGHV